MIFFLSFSKFYTPLLWYYVKTLLNSEETHIYICVYTYKLYSKKGKCEYGNYRRSLVNDFCFLHEIKFLYITVKFYQFMFIKSDSSEWEKERERERSLGKLLISFQIPVVNNMFTVSWCYGHCKLDHILPSSG